MALVFAPDLEQPIELNHLDAAVTLLLTDLDRGAYVVLGGQRSHGAGEPRVSGHGWIDSSQEHGWVTLAQRRRHGAEHVDQLLARIGQGQR
jgi:hypothetical protein